MNGEKSQLVADAAAAAAAKRNPGAEAPKALSTADKVRSLLPVPVVEQSAVAVAFVTVIVVADILLTFCCSAVALGAPAR